MAFSSHVWNQLKNLTKSEFISALERDGWVLQPAAAASGSARLYLKLGPNQPLRISIHYHSGSETFGPALLKGLLNSTRWNEQDLARLGLIEGGAQRREAPAQRVETVPCDCNDGTIEGSMPCPRCGGTRFIDVPL